MVSTVSMIFYSKHYTKMIDLSCRLYIMQQWQSVENLHICTSQKAVQHFFSISLFSPNPLIIPESIEYYSDWTLTFHFDLPANCYCQSHTQSNQCRFARLLSVTGARSALQHTSKFKKNARPSERLLVCPISHSGGHLFTTVSKGLQNQGKAKS